MNAMTSQITSLTIVHSFRHKSKKTPKLRVTGLCEGNLPVTREFPAQRAGNAENVFIWWRHHAQGIQSQHDVCNCKWLVRSSIIRSVRVVPSLPMYTMHYSGVIMGAMASQITSLTIVYLTVGSGTDQRKHQRSASLALRGEFTGDRWIPRTKGQ